MARQLRPPSSIPSSKHSPNKQPPTTILRRAAQHGAIPLPTQPKPEPEPIRSSSRCATGIVLRHQHRRRQAAAGGVSAWWCAGGTWVRVSAAFGEFEEGRGGYGG